MASSSSTIAVAAVGSSSTAGSSGNLYATLGVPENASKEEIRKAFRRLALVAHPDKGGKEKEEEFKRINLAVETLTDDDKRRAYDESIGIRAPVSPPTASSFSSTSSSTSSSSSPETCSSLKNLLEPYFKKIPEFAKKGFELSVRLGGNGDCVVSLQDKETNNASSVARRALGKFFNEYKDDHGGIRQVYDDNYRDNPICLVITPARANKLVQDGLRSAPTTPSAPSASSSSSSSSSASFGSTTTESKESKTGPFFSTPTGPFFSPSIGVTDLLLRQSIEPLLWPVFKSPEGFSLEINEDKENRQYQIKLKDNSTEHFSTLCRTAQDRLYATFLGLIGATVVISNDTLSMSFAVASEFCNDPLARMARAKYIEHQHLVRTSLINPELALLNLLYSGR